MTFSHLSPKIFKYLSIAAPCREFKIYKHLLGATKIGKQRGTALCAAVSLLISPLMTNPSFSQSANTAGFNSANPYSNNYQYQSGYQNNVGDRIAQTLVNYAYSRGWEVRTGSRRYNIYYVNGVSPFGVKNNRNPYYWDDARFLVEINPTPRLVGAWRATTRPSIYYVLNSKRRGGAAQVAPGFYPRKWRVGLHRNQEVALVQVAPMTVIRDTNRNMQIDYGDTPDTGLFGINQHSNKNPQTASAGCLVQEGNQREFMSYLQQDIDYQNNHKFLFSTGIISAQDLAF